MPSVVKCSGFIIRGTSSHVELSKFLDLNEEFTSFPTHALTVKVTTPLILPPPLESGFLLESNPFANLVPTVLLSNLP